MKLMKRISKTYNKKNCRGLSLPEAMVSMSVFSMFMTVCCGSMVQYQTTFGRIETSMTYTQQLQAGMNMMAREISQSNLSTFTNSADAEVVFPIDISKSPVYFKLAIGTNAHGDNMYDVNKISLSVNSSDQLVREEILPNGSVVDSKTLAVNVDKVVLSRLPEESDYIPNALSIEMTSTTTLSSKEQAMKQASQPSSGDCAEGQVARVTIVDGRRRILCVTLEDAETVGEQGRRGRALLLINDEGGSPEDSNDPLIPLRVPAPDSDNSDSSSNEKNYVAIERVVRLNN